MKRILSILIVVTIFLSTLTLIPIARVLAAEEGLLFYEDFSLPTQSPAFYNISGGPSTLMTNATGFPVNAMLTQNSPTRGAIYNIDPKVSYPGINPTTSYIMPGYNGGFSRSLLTTFGDANNVPIKNAGLVSSLSTNVVPVSSTNVGLYGAKKTVYLSYLMRYSNNAENEDRSLQLTNASYTGVKNMTALEIGMFRNAAAKDADGNKLWSLHLSVKDNVGSVGNLVKDFYVPTTKRITNNEVVLVVLKVEFGDNTPESAVPLNGTYDFGLPVTTSHKVSLYLNPSLGTEPGMPDAMIDGANLDYRLIFSKVNFSSGFLDALDELKIGTTYNSVIGASTDATATPSLTPTVVPTARPTPDNRFKLKPIGDTYTYSMGVTTNNGTAGNLAARPNVNLSYLKFQFGAVLPGSLVSLKLYLYAGSPLPATFSLYESTDQSWTEMGVTFQNHPTTGNLITTASATSLGYLTFDISTYAQTHENALVTFVLVSNTIAGSFYSRDSGSYVPRIEIIPPVPATPIPVGLHDAYTNANAPQANYGFSSDLMIRSSNVAETNTTYLKFNLHKAEEIGKSVVRLYCNRLENPSKPTSVSIYGVDDDTWMQGTLNFNTAPAVSTNELARATVDASGTFFEFDVTKYVRSHVGKMVSFKLIAEKNGNQIQCNSFQSTDHRPALINTKTGFTSLQPSSDSIMVYVSNDSGDDTNPGTQALPVKTLTKAATMVRTGYPDWILLKRGEAWTTQGLGDFKSGRSETEPIVVTYYGASGARPRLDLNDSFVNHIYGRVYHQRFVGLHLNNYLADPADPRYNSAADVGSAFRYISQIGGEDILIEDCKLSFFEIVFQGTDIYPYKDMRVRRSMISESYWRGSTTNNSSRPSGIYTDNVAGLLIEENAFVHNGWSEAFSDSLANMFNHNMYINTTTRSENLVIRGNIVASGSSYGIMCRPGGLVEDNLMVQNNVSMVFGYHAAPNLATEVVSLARNNVIMEGRPQIPGDGSWPQTNCAWGINLENLGDSSVTLQNNIVSTLKTPAGSVFGILEKTTVNYIDNIQYNWPNGMGEMNEPDWNDPTRSVASYITSTGLGNTYEDFTVAVLHRPVGTWPDELTAYSVNRYIRDGFSKGHEVTLQCPDAPALVNTGDAIYDTSINQASAVKVNVRDSYLSEQILATQFVDPTSQTATCSNLEDGKYLFEISRNGYLFRLIPVFVMGAHLNLGEKTLIAGDVFVDAQIDGSDTELIFDGIGNTYGDVGYNPAIDLNLDGIIDGTDTELVFSKIGLDLNFYGETVDYFS
ncbi:MAG: DNRLRE domain-containing protein [Clostridia bacterium]